MAAGTRKADRRLKAHPKLSSFVAGAYTELASCFPSNFISQIKMDTSVFLTDLVQEEKVFQSTLLNGKLVQPNKA